MRKQILSLKLPELVAMFRIAITADANAEDTVDPIAAIVELDNETECDAEHSSIDPMVPEKLLRDSQG